jgi:hypothetical protein
MQNELSRIREILAGHVRDDDGYCSCFGPGHTHTTRRQDDVACLVCGRPFENVVVEVVVANRQEFEQFYKDHPNDAPGQI